MTCGIYKIENLINNKVYIGQSTCIEIRWVNHKAAACKKDYPLYRAMRKYGVENFLFSIIEVVDKIELNSREIFWMGEYQSTKMERGYNISTKESSLVTFRKLDEYKLATITDKLANSSQTADSIALEFDVGVDTISEINQGKSWKQANLDYPIRKRVEAILYNCVDCGATISHKSTRCFECYSKIQRRVARPTKEKLIELIKEHGFVGVGKLYGVSDNSIRKWCKFYSIPTKHKEYRRG